MGPKSVVNYWETKTEGTLKLLLGPHKAVVIKRLESDRKLCQRGHSLGHRVAGMICHGHRGIDKTPIIPTHRGSRAASHNLEGFLIALPSCPLSSLLYPFRKRMLT